MTFRWRSLLWRTLGLLAAATLGLYLLLPSLIQRQITLALKDMGLPGVRMSVGMATPSGLVIRDLATSDQRLRIDRIQVDYDWASLRAARIRSVTVLGAELDVAITPDGQLDLGSLDQLNMQPGGGGGDPPLDEYKVYGTLRLTVDGQTSAMPFHLRGRTAGPFPFIDAAASLSNVPYDRAQDQLHARIVRADLMVQRPEPTQEWITASVGLHLNEVTAGDWNVGSVIADLRGKVTPSQRSVTFEGQIQMDSPDLGWVALEPVAFNYGDGSLTLRITLKNVALAPLTSASEEVATASGTLNGQLQLRLKLLPPYRASIDGGHLVASPGMTLRFGDPVPLQKLLNVSPESAVRDATEDTKRKLVEALQDFRYDTLRVTFVKQASDVVTRIEIDGRSNGPDATAVGPLTLNIGRVNDLINTELVDAAVRLPEWLERVIERLARRSTGQR